MDMVKGCSAGGFKILTILMLAAMVHGAHADGYRNPPPTAAGIGKSGVNRVFVDDASAISYNPANLTVVEGGSFVLDTTFAKTENTWDFPLNPAGEVDSEDSWVVLPNLYASLPVGDNGVVLGLGVTTPYGQGIEWAAADVFSPVAPVSLYEAEIKLIDIKPTVAFKLGDRVSVGVGADIYYSELEFDALTGTFPPPVAPPFPPPTGTARAEGDDVGFGGSIGVTWQITDRQRAVFTYTSEVELNYDGDLSATGTLLTDSSFGLEITYPNILAAGYGIELTDDIRIEANVEWLEWSVNKSQSADLGAANNAIFGGSLDIPQDWDDTFTFGVGGDWRLCDHWTLRVGYAFIETPIPDSTITPILPDADRQVLSFGLGYTHDRHSIDVAYSFSFYDDRDTATSPYPGDYDIDSDLVGLTYSYSF
jgi:long-chain fatty acid transport protein